MESDNHDQGDQGASHIQVRSYECNFCKRGFSNAQALGGHMNIHRKDKARLKQQSLDINIHHHKVLVEGKSNSTPEDQYAPLSRDENIHMRRKQLPLFAESPTNSTTETPQAGQLLHGETTTVQEGALMLSAASSELDLELRLGLEPTRDDSSAPTGTTRKFF